MLPNLLASEKVRMLENVSKIHRNPFAAETAPDSTGEAHNAPQTGSIAISWDSAPDPAAGASGASPDPLAGLLKPGPCICKVFEYCEERICYNAVYIKSLVGRHLQVKFHQVPFPYTSIVRTACIYTPKSHCRNV